MMISIYLIFLLLTHSFEVTVNVTEHKNKNKKTILHFILFQKWTKKRRMIVIEFVYTNYSITNMIICVVVAVIVTICSLALLFHFDTSEYIKNKKLVVGFVYNSK